LYALLTDDESPIGRKDPRWQILGFQGQDPATDFRGMGAFGLGQLCYLALKYTGEAKAMVAEQPEYPVACSGLNISHFVLNRLRDKESDKEKDKGNQGKERETVLRLMTALCVTGEIGVENVLNEVYCALVMYLDYLFAKEQAGYMQYPAVLARVCSKLDAVAEAAVAGRQHAPVRTIDAFRVLLFSHLSTTSVTSI
jgi:engulfment and cell motility protein 2